MILKILAEALQQLLGIYCTILRDKVLEIIDKTLLY